MEYLYKIKNRELICKTEKTKKVINLTGNEHKFLLLININEPVSLEMLSNALYGIYDKYSATSVRLIKHRLERKTPLKIKTIRGFGYILEKKINFF